MTQDMLHRILDLASREDKAELSVANNGKISAMRAYTSTPGKKSKEDYEVASAFYQETLDRLALKYLPDEQEDPESEDTSSLVPEWRDFRETKVKADVLAQLIAMGYDLTQRTFYRHCKQGKCRVNTLGFYSRRLVKQYIEAEGIMRTGEPVDADGPDMALSVEKQRLENEKLRISNQHANLKFKKEQAQLIEREALYLEMAARAVALDNGFRQMIDMEAATLIAAVKGDSSRLAEFLDLINQIWNGLLNTFAATDEFEVLFEDEEIPQ
ncbi:MAG: hypothetical protein VR65_10765 [Desulfobulbaceae bacterium BRH_c16a]|nr:MAG: hypothetical protein VR65_10765 [Desulfobulbaceae bacterium BRH_c16a]